MHLSSLTDRKPTLAIVVSPFSNPAPASERLSSRKRIRRVRRARPMRRRPMSRPTASGPTSLRSPPSQLWLHRRPTCPQAASCPISRPGREQPAARGPSRKRSSTSFRRSRTFITWTRVDQRALLTR